MSARPRLSIVVPVHNEASNLPELFSRLTTVLTAANLTYEILIVNDGSTDESLALLREFHATDPRLKVINLARNFGHQVAISAGLDHARGDGIVLMDADLQDPPEVIPDFIRKWDEGYQVVYGTRRKRKENVFKRSAYAVFYRLLRQVSDIEIPLDTGDFSLIDARVADVMRTMPERARFVRGLRSWVGFRQIGIEYPRSSRLSGEPKYTFSKLLKLALDGLLSFSILPLRLAVYLGLSIAALSFLGSLYYLWGRLMSDLAIPGFATTIIVVLFLGGVQLVTLGILGEYLGRVYEEVKARPLYVVGETLGIER